MYNSWNISLRSLDNEVSVLNLSEGLLVIHSGGLCDDFDTSNCGCSDTTSDAGGKFVSLLEVLQSRAILEAGRKCESLRTHQITWAHCARPIVCFLL